MRRRMVVGVTATAIGVGGFVAAAAEAQTVVPVRVSDAGNNVVMIATVTINGVKVPMTVDTGATNSTINARVAKKLKLASAGKPETTQTTGCKSKVQPVSVPAWTLGDAALPATTLSASRGGGTLGTAGLLGNDVLQTFGRVSFDFADRRLVLGDTVTGQPFAFPSFGLVAPKAPDRVLWPLVRVTIKGRTTPFIADTGASNTLIDSKVAKRAKLKRVGKPLKIGAVNCTTTARRVALTRWSAGDVPLPPGIVLSKPKAGLGTGGLLGAPALSSFGQVTVDYKGEATAVTLGFPAPAPAVEPAPTTVPTAEPTVAPQPTATPTRPPEPTAEPTIPPQPTG